jgi:hypothetical protein
MGAHSGGAGDEGVRRNAQRISSAPVYFGARTGGVVSSVLIFSPRMS